MPQLLHTSSQPAWAHDIDAALIHGGLLKAPRLLDTLHCWTGTWVGQVSFYRPLSSYVFWFERKLSGERDRYYALVAVAAHIAATVLFGV